jgi:hypothetical protein
MTAAARERAAAPAGGVRWGGATLWQWPAPQGAGEGAYNLAVDATHPGHAADLAGRSVERGADGRLPSSSARRAAPPVNRRPTTRATYAVSQGVVRVRPCVDNQRVEVGWAPADDGPRAVAFEQVDAAIQPGVNPYYLRVRQRDGAMAWSSPIYVEWAARRSAGLRGRTARGRR